MEGQGAPLKDTSLRSCNLKYVTPNTGTGVDSSTQEGALYCSDPERGILCLKIVLTVGNWYINLLLLMLKTNNI